LIWFDFAEGEGVRRSHLPPGLARTKRLGQGRGEPPTNDMTRRGNRKERKEHKHGEDASGAGNELDLPGPFLVTDGHSPARATPCRGAGRSGLAWPRSGITNLQATVVSAPLPGRPASARMGLPARSRSLWGHWASWVEPPGSGDLRGAAWWCRGPREFPWAAINMTSRRTGPWCLSSGAGPRTATRSATVVRPEKPCTWPWRSRRVGQWGAPPGPYRPCREQERFAAAETTAGSRTPTPAFGFNLAAALEPQKLQHAAFPVPFVRPSI
jgi:hypothetical protein